MDEDKVFRLVHDLFFLVALPIVVIVVAMLIAYASF